MSVVVRRRWPVLTLVVLTAGVTTAQQGTNQPVGPDEIRKLAGRLKALSPEVLPFGFKPEEVKGWVEKLKADNPNATPQELLERVYSAFGITDPARRSALEQQARQHMQGGGQGGSSPPDDARNVRSPARPQAPSIPPPPQPNPSPGLRPTRGADGVGGIQIGPESLPRPGGDGTFTIPEGNPTGPGGRYTRTRPDGRQVSDQVAGTNDQYRAVAQWWEQNVGPLDKSPAVRNTLMEMFAGRNEFGQRTGGSLGEVLESAAKSVRRSDAAKLLPSALPELGGWHRPEVNPGSWLPGPPGPPSGSPSFSVPGGGSWLPVIVLGAVAVVGVALFWLWPRLTGTRDDQPTPVPGLGPWPVDPRSITDRDGLVRAFEYLSVLLHGTAARTWNHRTIAEAFLRNVPNAAVGADELAEAYAVARYTPADQPMTAEQVAAARRHLCRIAGVRPA